MSNTKKAKTEDESEVDSIALGIYSYFLHQHRNGEYSQAASDAFAAAEAFVAARDKRGKS